MELDTLCKPEVPRAMILEDKVFISFVQRPSGRSGVAEGKGYFFPGFGGCVFRYSLERVGGKKKNLVGLLEVLDFFF